MSQRSAAPAAEPAAAPAAAPAADGPPAGEVQSLSDVDSALKKTLYDSSNPILCMAMERLEGSTGLKREKFAYGVISVVGLYLIVGSLAELICNLIGFAYPAYASVKAVRSETKDDDTQWLIYWTCFAFFSLIDFFAERICSWFPIYWLVKTIFLIYLSAPQTRGALRMYKRVVNPAVTKLDEIWDKYAKKLE